MPAISHWSSTNLITRIGPEPIPADASDEQLVCGGSRSGRIAPKDRPSPAYRPHKSAHAVAWITVGSRHRAVTRGIASPLGELS